MEPSERIHDLNEFLKGHPELDLTGKVTRGKLIGLGGYSDVYAGTFHDNGGTKDEEADGREPVKIAIKSIRIFVDGNEDIERTIVRELDIWRKLHHPNVLELMGFAHVEGMPSFISAWMENSTSRKYLKNNVVSINEKYEILKGTADGLCYLHDGGTVHSDLKPDNILITPDGRPVLTDFGISRVKDESHTITGTKDLKGSLRYMAVELIDALNASNHLHTKATDVWAFGMVAFELLHDIIPFEDLKTETAVIQGIRSGSVPKQTCTVFGGDAVMRMLLEKTWRKIPAERPSMKVVAHVLEAIKDWKNETLAEDGREFLERLQSAELASGEILALSVTTKIVAGPVALSPDNSTIASALGIAFQLFRADTGEALTSELVAHKKNINMIEFSPNGTYVATWAEKDTICVWNVTLGKLVSQFPDQYAGGQFAIGFTRIAENLYLNATTRGTHYTYDIHTGAVISKKNCVDYAKQTVSPTFSIDGERVYSWPPTFNGSYLLKYSQSGLETGPIIPEFGPFSISALREKTDNYYAWKCDMVTRYIKPVDTLILVEVWDMKKVAQIGDTPLLGPFKVDGLDKVRLTNNGDVAMVFGNSGNVQMYSLRTRRSLHRPMKLHYGGVKNGSFSDDRSKLVTTGSDNTIRVWDISKIFDRARS